LLSLIAILGLVAVVITGLVASLGGTQRQLIGTGTSAASTINEFINVIKEDLLATGDALATSHDPGEILRRALDRDRELRIFELAIIDPQGRVLEQRRRVGQAEPTVTEQPWLATVEIGSVYVGPVDYEKYGVPFVDIAAPIIDEEGYFAATLVAEVDLGSLWDEIRETPVGETGYIYVTDSRGYYLAYPKMQLVGPDDTLRDQSGYTPKEIAEASFVRPYTSLEGKTVASTAIPLDAAPWYVVVEQPVGEAWRVFLLLSVTLLALLLIVGLLVYSIIGFTRRRITIPLLTLRDAVDVLRQGNLGHRIDIQTRDEFGELASTFNTMANQLQEMVGTLEQRVAERTRGLQAAAEVSRATTSVLDPEQLLRQVVDLVRDRFNLYYAGLFLIEEEPGTDRTFAVLRAGTGEAGRRMVAQRHSLEVGGDSMIGQCVVRAEARIALDVGEEAAHFDNPLLPETRSEMALPLRSRDRVIGAMTVQSVREAAFDEADIAVMQTVADQVAVAIDNARLFADTETALAELETTHRRYLGRAWEEYAAPREISGYEQTDGGIEPIGKEMLAETQQAVMERRPVTMGGDGGEQAGESPTLVVPISLRGQPIGALGFRNPEGRRQWNDDDVALADAVAEQLALAVDNLRLLDETQRRAAREQLTTGVTARMRETLDIETVLQTAIREIGDALHLAKVQVRMGSGEATETTDG
jgi:GAF domain-containing protein/HAMP domain-containing protein